MKIYNQMLDRSKILLITTSMLLPLVLHAENDLTSSRYKAMQSAKIDADIFNLDKSFSMHAKSIGQESNQMDCMIEPFSVVEVASATSGVVEEMKVDRGSIVEKGQVIAVLESTLEKANAEHSAAKYEFHKKKYQRLKKLFERKVISYHELEEEEAERELAKLESKKAQDVLRMRTITSPFSGIVVEKFISPGELTEQQKVIKIARVNPLKVEMIAPVEIYGSVEKGMWADIFPEGPVSGPYQAEVDIVDKVIDAASGTFGIRLELANPRFEIPAGLKCSAKFIPKTKKFTKQTKKPKLRVAAATTSINPAKEKNDAQTFTVTSMDSTSTTTTMMDAALSGMSASASNTFNTQTISAVNVAGKAQLLANVSASNILDYSRVNSTAESIYSSLPTIGDLQGVVSQLSRAYEAGDVERLGVLFDHSIVTNDQSSLPEIKQDYAELFKNTNERKLYINGLDWKYRDNHARGVGKFYATIITDSDGVRIVKGKIQLVAKRVEDKILITHLYHYDEKIY